MEHNSDSPASSALRVVGFTFSQPETTLNERETYKLQTQRSLLSELLSVHALEEALGADLSDEDSLSDIDDYQEERTPVVRQNTDGELQRSVPIAIPCCQEQSVVKQKEAMRRAQHQRQVEQYYYQQQQQQLYQQQQQFLIQQQQLEQQQSQRREQQAGMQPGVVAPTRGRSGQPRVPGAPAF